jgi:hypothetical protein
MAFMILSAARPTSGRSLAGSVMLMATLSPLSCKITVN